MLEKFFSNSSFAKIKLPLDEDIVKDYEHWLPSDKVFGNARQMEFIAGRICAQLALRKLGQTISYLPILPNGQPQWPQDYIGSISHTKNIAIAVVSNKLKAVGVDIEHVMTIERFERISRAISTRAEQKIIQSGNDLSATVLFSAKESLYKLLAPITNTYFGFLEASLVYLDHSTFTLELHSQKALLSQFNGIYHGKYVQFEKLIITYLEML